LNRNDKNPNLLQGQNIQQETEIKLLKGLLDRISAYATGLEEELGTVKKDINRDRGSSEKWEHEARQLRIALDDLYSSRSWKLTLPVRMFSRLVRWILLPLRSFKGKNPQMGKTSCSKGPGLNSDKKMPPGMSGSTEMSPRETDIYHELLQIINKKKNEN
jgi:hypothetical protein